MERIEAYLNQFADFLWEQFERDMEMSQRAIRHFDEAVDKIHAFFRKD
jgi:hypothetical protein